MNSSYLRPTFIGFYEKYKLINNFEKQTVYLLGQGWLAKGFVDTIDKNRFKIINISRNNFINTPQLLQNIKLNKNITYKLSVDEYHNEIIEDINLDTKEIKTNKTSYNWSSSYLVCGLGSHIDQGEYWLNTLEKIKQINKQDKINIIGMGPTGTELTFHLSDLGYNITLFDALSIENTYSFLSTCGKETLLNLLTNYYKIPLVLGRFYDKNIDKGHLIFATGSKPNDLTSKWKITNKLNLENHDNVFAGGDGIVQNLPRNAQVAYQQGVYIAKKINGEKLDEFNFINNGISIYCGNNKCLVEINNQTIILPSFLIDLYYDLKNL